MKDDIPPKKEQKDSNSNNKSEQNPNLTSSPQAPKPTSHINNLSPEKNGNFPSKENYFGVKASPILGMGRTSSSGAHSPILNYYSNISSDGKEYYYSPKEGMNQNSFNSNKLSPMNFNFSSTSFFNAPSKNNNQNKDFLNSEEDNKTLQEKMESFVNNNNTIGRKYSIPSYGSNLPESKNEDEENDDDDGEEMLTLSIIDSGDENYLPGNNNNKNMPFGGEQEKKANKGNSNNNIETRKESEINQKDKNISGEQSNKNDDNTEKKFHTIYDNIQKSQNDNNNRINNNIYNKNIINNLNMNEPNPNVINNMMNRNMNNNFNFYNMNNIQNSNQQPKQEGSLVQNIINKQEFKPFIPNKLRNQFQEQEIPNYYYNNMNMNMNMNYALNNKNYSEDMNFNKPYNSQYENANMMNNRNNIYMNNMNNLNNFNNNINNNINNNLKNNYYMNNNIFKNPYYINNNMPNNFPNINQFLPNNNFIMPMPNINTNNMNPEENPNNNSVSNFMYKGDKYQITNTKDTNKNDKGEIRSISEADIVTAITANNKVIKRIDPNTYLNASLEYLSYNILPLAKDQAGCRFLQEKLSQDPNAANAFYKAILPYILNLVKDPFGNYLIQKLCDYLDQEGIKKIIEIISPNILDIGSNSHGTRVIQYLVNFLKTKELVDYFLSVLKPHVISLLKELNGTHIINKFINDHQECANEINKIIIENSAALATHRHGCCILQRLLDRPDEKFRNDLVANLVENCFVLIIDQFGNYVIQSILLSNDMKAAGAIALKICDNIQYYSKHRYSSNVIEKCFDHCGKREQKILVQKICSPTVISDLILDEHGNYVVQKALYYADPKEKEIILNNIIMLTPKIRLTSFGEKLLNRLVLKYPMLSVYIYGNNISEYMQNLSLENNNNFHQKNKKKKGKKKKKNSINNNNNENNNNNNTNENMFFNNSNPFLNNNNFMNNNINVNNNITINNYNNINNAQNNQTQNKNQNNDKNSISYINYNNNMINDFNQNQKFMQRNMNNNNENDNKKKGKKKRKNKNKKYSNDANEQYENNVQEEEIDTNKNEN